MIDDYIAAIIKIANHSTIKQHLEPDLMWHENVKEWQVKRILYAEGLLLDELSKDTRGTIPEITVPN